MKEATTQQIIRQAPITKDMGDHWEVVYMNVAKLMEQSQNNRIFRFENSLLFYTITEPKIASGIVFSIDPPRTQAKAFVEFATALSKSGFKKLTVATNLELAVKLLAKAGFDGDILAKYTDSKIKDLHDIEIYLQGSEE